MLRHLTARAAWLVFAGLVGCAEGAQGSGAGGSGATGAGGQATGGGGAGGNGAAGSTTTSAGPGSNSASSGSGGDGGAPATSSTSTDATTGSTSTGPGGGAPGTLFFSEYVEGSGNDKAVEIVNLGSTPFALGTCQIEGYQNGASSPSVTITLSGGDLAPGAVHVLCHSAFTAPGACDQLDGNLQHSGDDVVALICSGVTKDVFGRIGEQMVWGQGTTSSKDADLRRRCDVTQGDANGNDAFDPADEWNGFSQDDFSGLGQYGCP